MAPAGGPSGVVVTGVGMVTPVGIGAEASVAAIRGGISMIGELEYFTIENDWFEEVALNGAAIAGQTDGYLGLGRWTRLAAGAVNDLLETADLSQDDLDRVGLYLALPPAQRDGYDSRINDMLATRVGQWLGLDGLGQRTRTFQEGHAAGAGACREAIADLSSGKVTHAVVCGVDSLVEPETLRFFHEKKRLKTEDNVDGFIPGEGAACLLLELSGTSAGRGATVLSQLEAPCVATEPVTIWSEEPTTAVGLSETVGGTLGQLTDGGAEMGLVVCDLNGESYRSKEFGLMVPRSLNAVTTDWEVWHPADCIGDTGAASFAISACLGVAALHQGLPSGTGALVWGSSDDGLRGSVYLRSAT